MRDIALTIITLVLLVLTVVLSANHADEARSVHDQIASLERQVKTTL